MSEILRSPITHNAVLLIPRSGSHSLAVAAMRTFWPDIEITNEAHPAIYFGCEEWWDGTNKNIAIIVRNPIERFRSMCAHRPDRTIKEQLADPIYGPLPTGNFVCYFRFEDQLNEAAKWLGLPTPLPQEDATDPASKPNLTLEQESIVKKIYADDIALWESLQQQ
jgi:hypothetical protein